MTINTVILIPETVHGTPSGNYDGSSLDFIGDPQKAANYYRGRGGLQTVWFRVYHFTGVITIQATLDADPLNARWVDNTTYDPGPDITDAHPVNIVGNFTWLRAVVTDFSAGTINLVSANY